MTRFYLRIVLIIFLALVASIVAFQRLVNVLEEHFFKPKAIQQLHALGETLRGRFEGLDPEQARKALEEIEEVEIQVVPLDDAGGFGAASEPLGPRGAGTKRLFIDFGNRDYGVMIRADDHLIRRYVKEEERYLLRGLLQMCLIIGIAGFFIVRPLVRKLRVQETTIAKIADGDLSARVDVKSKDALGRLSQRLNLMAERIQELLGQQRQLIQAVSHEMRTPTARIGFALELLSEAKTEEERQRRIASLHEDLADMEALLEELLTFLRFEEAGTHLKSSPEDLLAMAEAAGEKARRFQPEIEIRVYPEQQGPLRASVSARYFPRVLENLLINAVRHARNRIAVTLERNGGGVTVAVEDDGPGIPASEAERVFEPFVRLDPSRNRRSGGTGLGLAITKRIVERHRGEIRVEQSATLKGARFVVTLPDA